MNITENNSPGNNYLNFKTLLIFGLLLFLIPKTIFTSPGIYLDPSWMISVNMAIKEHLIFGKDYIFTYGPLAYLSTGLPVFVSGFLIVIFYLFISANGIYFIHYLTKPIQRKNEMVFIALSLVLTGHFLFSSDTITLYFYFIFHIFHFLKHKNFLSIFLASVCCLLSFYIKVNSGLIVNILFLIFLIFNFYKKNISAKKTLSYLVMHFIALFSLSFILNTDFFGYISNSLPIIDSYNDAMAIPWNNRYEMFAVTFIILIISMAGLYNLKKIYQSTFELFLVFNISIFIFIVFKQSFVRADNHVNYFFSSIGYIVILPFLFSEIRLVKASFYYVIIATFIFSISAYRGSPFSNFKRYNDITKFSEKTKNKQKENKFKRKLPEQVLKEIGKHSVDILGYEISYLYYNDLKYNPRPVIQSYSAYDKKLIQKNAFKYTSNTSPDYVLYHYGSIDDRHGFWDEPDTYLSLFRNYHIIDTIYAPHDFISLLVFKKNTALKEIKQQVILDTLIYAETKIRIPVSNQILYLALDYDYTIPGQIRRILFQPSHVFMNLYYENSDSTRCKLIQPIMKSGVPINKKVTNFAESTIYFATHGKGNLNATYFELNSNSLWINEPFRMRIISYQIAEN